MSLLAVATVAILVLTATPLAAHTITVDVRGTGDFLTIYQGVYNAADGDTVLVKPGLYTGDWNRDIEFGGRGIKLLSDQGPTTTWIDCEGLGRAFKFESGEDSTAVVQGFTIRNGYSSYGGSAILAGGTSPELLDLVIEDCRASGGYWYVRGGAIRCNASAAPLIRDVVFSGNTGGQGGGILCYGGASPLVENCTFAGNRGTYGGAAVYAEASNPTIRRSVLAFGSAGGGVACVEGAVPTIEECIIYGNAGGDEACGDIISWLSEDPLFCDIESGGFEVCDESPCLPENNPFGVLIGARDAGPCDCPQPPKVWHVPGDFVTITAALEEASFGDTVLVSPGLYSEEQLEIPWGVSLIATDGPDTTTIEAAGGRCVVFGADVSDGPPRASSADGIDVPELSRNGPPAVLDGFTLTGATQGALRTTAASPVIRNCVITSNSAYEGAAIFCDRYSAPLIDGCRLTENTGTETYSGYGGGAVCVKLHSAPEFVRTTLAHNLAKRGAAIYVNSGSSATLEECTLAANMAEIGSGLYVEEDAAADIDASVLAHAEMGEAVHCETGSDVTVTHSVVFGNAGGDSLCGTHADNIFDDPLFCDWGSGDFAVCSESPCLPQNNSYGIQIGVEGDSGCPCPTGSTIRVPEDYSSIAAAADAAVAGDTILVAAGVYEESNIDLRPGVPLLSRAGSDSTTIIASSGTAILIGALARPGVDPPPTQDVSSVERDAQRSPTFVRGFTITGATASAIRIVSCEVTIEDVWIRENSANNRGGGVYCANGSITVVDSRFDDNTITGAYYNSYGGALYCYDSVTHLERVEFRGNYASQGGAVMLHAYATPMDDVRVIDCVMLGNSADDGAGIRTRGGVVAEVRGSTFARNASDTGSAVAATEASIDMSNCVVAFPLWGSSFFCDTDAQIDLQDCVIFADPDGETPCASMSNVVFSDPLFCDLGEGDLSVCADSPCLPANGLFDTLVGALGDGGCACPEPEGVTIRVPADQPTIADALAHATYADTVLLSPGIYSEHELHVPWGVAVVGELGPQATVVDAGGAATAFKISVMPANRHDGVPTRLSGVTVLGASDSALRAKTGRPVIENCVFTGNSAYLGGAMRLMEACSARITDVLFLDNESSSYDGGAVYCMDGSDAEFTRCTFAGNSASHGGAICCELSDAIVTECTFVGNSSNTGSSIFTWSGSTAHVKNSILAFGGESRPIIVGTGSTAITEHCVVFGNAGTDSLQGTHHDNLFVDPLFCHWESGDYGVHADSPALPHNNPWYEPVGAWPENCGYTVVVVRPDGTGTAPTLQAGIDMCGDLGTVVAESGTFTGPGNRGIDMAGMGTRLLSRYGPEHTTIDCEGADRAFIFSSGEDSTSVVRGFSIINGQADDGGGMLMLNSSPLIRDCSFHDCLASRGGAIACVGATTAPVLRDIEIATSSATEGGALWASASMPLLTSVSLTDNSAEYGGAVHVAGGAHATLTHAEFIQNSATLNGGAVYVESATATITNATLLGNSAAIDGAAISCVDADLLAAGCIVMSSTLSPVTECVGSGGPVFTYCNLYGNAGGDDFCGIGTVGNISEDPRFCDLASFDLTLCEDSPCLVPDAPSGHIGRHAAGCDSCGPATVVLFVRPDGTGDVPTLQEAIDACPEEGTVVASAGIFTGEGNRDLDLGGKGITVKSIAGSETTTIDCGGESRAFTISSGEDDTSVVRGFTITNGVADEGGGILCESSSPILDDIVLEGCTADLGGGIAITDGASPAVSDVVITACSALQGGGLACTGGSVPEILEIRIEANTAVSGAGLWVSESSPDISHVALSGNIATAAGGGAHIAAGSTPTIRLATVSGNEAGAGGGAISSESSAPTIGNATFVGNTAPASAALAFLESDADITGCVIALTNDGSAAICTGAAQPTFTDCIFHENALGDDLCGIDGGGNMFEDPLFCDAILGDLTVCADSPCLVPGVSGGQIGRYGAGCDSCGTDYYSVLADGSGDLPTIQAAIDVCDFGDVIIVGVGTFSGIGNRDIDFGGKRLKLRTVLGPEQTIIDCEGAGRGFRFASGEDTLSIVRGFTITGGHEGDGGAILASGSSPLIEDCIIRDCSAERGGAIACANNASPLLRRLDIIGNEADDGGGVHASGGAPMLRDIVLRANTARGSGGGLACRTNTHLDMRRAAFIDNAAEESGGGAHCFLSAPLLQNVTFVGNAAPTGGTLSSPHAAPHLNGCVLSFATDGEGMYCEGALAPFVEHCVVYGNAAGDELCGTDGGDNHFVDPLFCDLPGGDLTLCENSVCIRPVAPEFHIGMYGAGCDSCGTTTEVPEIDLTQVSVLHLSALPNPFTGETTVHFELPAACGDVLLRVYNLRGQTVRTLVDGARPAGRWQAPWNGLDESGRRVASGVYFCRLLAAGETATSRIVLLH